ncbi:hypothetical protein [Nitrospirillum amazonense]|uniref:hypothetical protein n=1 Tax=Nitrospirillum amazonense TaxID=28077 RepID=UPI0024121924|nr:hypothetical protein [Nitrospirillum amazonense]MDG3442140.1 hypothetical protein [Nitrospirillum amazonense]
MLNLYFLPVAQSEIEAARQWYDDQLPDLGIRFLIAVDGVLARIQGNPHQFPVVRAGIPASDHKWFSLCAVFQGEWRQRLCHRGRSYAAPSKAMAPIGPSDYSAAATRRWVAELWA